MSHRLTVYLIASPCHGRQTYASTWYASTQYGPIGQGDRPWQESNLPTHTGRKCRRGFKPSPASTRPRIRTVAYATRVAFVRRSPCRPRRDASLRAGMVSAFGFRSAPCTSRLGCLPLTAKLMATERVRLLPSRANHLPFACNPSLGGGRKGRSASLLHIQTPYYLPPM